MEESAISQRVMKRPKTRDYSTLWLTIRPMAAIFNRMVKQSVRHLDIVFHALADHSRRDMLRKLAAKDYSITELADPYDMSLAAVSKHVKYLERAGLVSRSVAGRVHTIHLNAKPLGRAQRWLQFYERLWNDQLDKLEDVLKQQTRE
jgi:DNA-binding transcriptional ArsR family regulator